MSGTLSSIYNNVSFALNLQMEAMARLQEQASTGSRINRASDDPSTAFRVLGLNSQQRSLENYMDNLSQAISILDLSSHVLEGQGGMIQALVTAKTSLTQVTGGIFAEDPEGRETITRGINEILEQIVSLANTKYTGHYVFGGSNSTSAPYVVQRTDGEITSVTYQGSYENRDVEVAPGMMTSVLYVGEDIFRSNNRGDPIFLGNTGAKPGTGTSSVRGDTWLTVTFNDVSGQYELSIDDGATKVAVPPGGDTNQAVTDSQTGRVLYVDSTQINSTGVEMVRVPGTYDVFNTLISIRDTLRKTDLPNADELQTNLLNSLDEVHKLLVQNTVVLGSKTGFLENLKDSLQKLKYDAEDEVTRLEEADIAQIAVDLSRYEVLYQMALLIAGKLMSMSLLDFIR